MSNYKKDGKLIIFMFILLIMFLIVHLQIQRNSVLDTGDVDISRLDFGW